MKHSDLPFPVVRLEVEGMRRTMVAALSEASMKLDEDLKHAVELACEPSRVAAVLQEEAWRHTQEALKDAVRHWFLFTAEGQGVIRDEVAKLLRERYGFDDAPSKVTAKEKP